MINKKTKTWLITFIIVIAIMIDPKSVISFIFNDGYAISETVIQGIANVHDGDTLTINKQKIRLQGIDAPELKQKCQKNEQSYSCGIEAKQQLLEFTDGLEVRCNIVDYDKYQRALGHCFVRDMNLNAQMVASGHALAYIDYSKLYLPQEIVARANRLGIHAGTYIEPWQWRRKNKHKH